MAHESAVYQRPMVVDPWRPATRRMNREDRDELALVLFERMRTRRPVWVDSIMGQRCFVQAIELNDDGELVAYDQDGNDRLCSEYLLTNPGRPESGGMERER